MIGWGWIVVGAIIGLIALYVLVIRPWHLRWGTTCEELSGARPGDDLLPTARIKATHAIDIHAAPSEVWPWLVQMGQGRAGMYSYELIENRLMGLDMHNSDRIIPEFQDLKVGDIVPLGPDNFGPPVAILDPGRTLVLAGDTRADKSITPMRPGDFWAVYWGFYLDEQKDGSTRLVERWGADWKPGLLNFVFYRVFMEFGAFVMEHRMLLGIKARAENLAREKSGGRAAGA